MEEIFILRVRDKALAARLSRILDDDPAVGNDKSIDLSFTEDGRTGMFVVGDDSFPAALLDLPTIVESYATYDDENLVKIADVGQIIIVGGPDYPIPPANNQQPKHEEPGNTNPPANKQESKQEPGNPNPPADDQEEPEKYDWPPDRSHESRHGLTRAMRYARSLRFRESSDATLLDFGTDPAMVSKVEDYLTVGKFTTKKLLTEEYEIVDEEIEVTDDEEEPETTSASAPSDTQPEDAEEESRSGSADGEEEESSSGESGSSGDSRSSGESSSSGNSGSRPADAEEESRLRSGEIAGGGTAPPASTRSNMTWTDAVASPVLHQPEVQHAGQILLACAGSPRYSILRPQIQPGRDDLRKLCNPFSGRQGH